MEPIGNPETSVSNHLTSRNNPKDVIIHFNRDEACDLTIRFRTALFCPECTDSTFLRKAGKYVPQKHTSRHVTSRHITSRHVTSRHVTSQNAVIFISRTLLLHPSQKHSTSYAVTFKMRSIVWLRDAVDRQLQGTISAPWVHITFCYKQTTSGSISIKTD